MEFLIAERKKEVLPFVIIWIEVESVMLSKMSQMIQDKYHMTSPITGT